ncbi:hypothetical protein [Streptomyces sp. NPDC048565]|uniref:hypothetical protein n=1 Tax=Streptomyces sp. NPDC048565 TaxID=3155266 RepID=UPI003439BE2B
MKRAQRGRARPAAVLAAAALLSSACASADDEAGGNQGKGERTHDEFGLIGDQPKAGKPVRGGTLNIADHAEARSLSPAHRT